jgi:hypothetical protein
MGVLLGAVLVGAAWFAGWMEPPEGLARTAAAWAAVYPGDIGGAEVERIPCPPLDGRVRLYVVCTRDCEEVWQVVLVKGLQTSRISNPGRLPAEEPGTGRRRMNAALAQEGLSLDAAGAREMAACHMRLEGMQPALVLPVGGFERVAQAREQGEEWMRDYALALDDPSAVDRIPIEETGGGFAASLLYWDTYAAGRPVLRLTMRLLRDGRLEEMIVEPPGP